MNDVTEQIGAGRARQKLRTRTALVDAARRLADAGGEVTMPAVAEEALVSEATAYRYFPDLLSLLRTAMEGIDAAAAMQEVGHTDDPVVRVARAAEVLGRDVARRQGAVRAVIAGSITRPGGADRPGHRFALIEHALAPWVAQHGPQEQLVRDLAVVVSAEAYFTLVDLCGLTSDDAVASMVRTARTLTAAAIRD